MNDDQQRRISLSNLLTELPVPRDYLQGVRGLQADAPREILVFHRTTREGVLDGGVHVHPRMVLCLCLDGPGVLTVDGRMLSVDNGQGLLLFPFQQHHYSSLPEGEVSWLYLSFTLAQTEDLEELRFRPFSPSEEVWGFVRHAIETFSLATEGDLRAANETSAWLTLILMDLLREHTEVPLPKVPAGVATPHMVAVRNTVRTVYEHLDQDWDISELAARVNLSPSSLRRVFRDQMRTSLGRFMLAARLNHARALLQTSDMTIGEIAEAC